MEEEEEELDPALVRRVVDAAAEGAMSKACSLLLEEQTLAQYSPSTHEALRKLLAVLLVVAWKLLVIRTVARLAPQAPATVVLTPLQVQLLKALHDKQHPRKPLPAMPTAKEAMYALAGLAGHFKSNGDPGWQTLGRGLRRLLQAEHDYRLFVGVSDPASGVPSSNATTT